jgi:hypothetical protein
MHREIMKTPDGMKCDHINHNTLNNTRKNLRNATNSENMMNRKGAQSNSISGERNITPRGNSFTVCVGLNGKTVFSKTFKTIEEARIARDNALKKYHGEFSSF